MHHSTLRHVQWASTAISGNSRLANKCAHSGIVSTCANDQRNHHCVWGRGLLGPLPGLVLSQDVANVEVEFIVVDDASPDRSGAILATRHDPRLTVIRSSTTVGPGRARELGAKEATGEYLWFVDGDDEPPTEPWPR